MTAAPPQGRGLGQGGIVLIEVLVSLLIFAFGVLGLVGLQAAMTRTQTASDARAQAGYLASEIIGQMWVDQPNLAAYGSCAASSPSCKDWQAKVASQLPGGQSTLTVSATGDVSVLITWSLPHGQTHSYSTQAALR